MKEQKNLKNAQNISKAPKNAQSLFKELNKIASRDADKESVDENGNVVETYFCIKHTKRDLDCYFDKGDLTNVSAKDLRRVMRFDQDDLDYAKMIDFLYTRKGITNLVGEGIKVTHLKNFVSKKVQMHNLMIKEAEVKVPHPSKP